MLCHAGLSVELLQGYYNVSADFPPQDEGSERDNKVESMVSFMNLLRGSQPEVTLPLFPPPGTVGNVWRYFWSS